MDELGRDGMQIDDAIDAVVVFLQGDEFPDGAKIIAEMKVARRLDAGKDKRLDSGHKLSCGLVEGPHPWSKGLSRQRCPGKRSMVQPVAVHVHVRARDISAGAPEHSRQIARGYAAGIGPRQVPSADGPSVSLGAERRLRLRLSMPASAPPIAKARPK